MKLEKDFYTRDTLTVAKDLLGKVLITDDGTNRCGGIIIETEAYLGKTDRACHSYKAKPNGRTNVMYQAGGVSYVYLIYGMYYCFNIVTEKENVPEAVLIRTLEPLHGIDVMCSRRGVTKKDNLCSGPSKLCRSLAITASDSGADLTGGRIYLEDTGIEVTDIKATPRININYAGEDALLPYRFIIR